MSDRIITPVIAVGLALLVWLYMRSRNQEVLDNYPVPVELQVASTQAEHYDLVVNGPGHIPVSFTGPYSRIRELRGLLQRGAVRIQRTVSVPEERLADARYIDVIRLDAAEVPVLPGVQAVIAENQNRIPILLRRLIEKRLPVRLSLTAEDRVERAVVEPNVVLVRGPKEVLEREDYVATELYPVPPQPATEPLVMEKPDRIRLVQELEGTPIRVTPPLVSVRLTLKPRQRIHELTDVPVHFLCPANFPYRPQFTSERAGKVTLRVLGPAIEERPTVAAYLDLTARKFGSGLHAEEPVRVQLPAGFELAQEPPRVASFQLVPLEDLSKSAGAALSPR
jgi:hypothetical protein